MLFLSWLALANPCLPIFQLDYLFFLFVCFFVFFLVLSCRSSLQILDANPVSDMSFANIFSQSVGCVCGLVDGFLRRHIDALVGAEKALTLSPKGPLFDPLGTASKQDARKRL